MFLFFSLTLLVSIPFELFTKSKHFGLTTSFLKSLEVLLNSTSIQKNLLNKKSTDFLSFSGEMAPGFKFGITLDWFLSLKVFFSSFWWKHTSELVNASYSHFSNGSRVPSEPGPMVTNNLKTVSIKKLPNENKLPFVDD